MREMKQELNQRMDIMQEDMNNMQEDMNNMKEDMNNMKEDINGMKIDMKVMKQDIEEMKVDIKIIKWEQSDTTHIVKTIVNQIGEINRKINEQAKDKCAFHKTLVGAKAE